MRFQMWIVVALLAVSSVAAGQPGPGNHSETNPDELVPEIPEAPAKPAFDLGQWLDDTAGAVGDAAGSAMSSIAEGFGNAVTAIFSGIGTAFGTAFNIAGTLLVGVFDASLWAGSGFAAMAGTATITTFQFTSAAASALGGAASLVVVATVTLIFATTRFIGSSLADAWAAYIGVIDFMRPTKMSPGAFEATAASSAAASVGVTGYAFWDLLRRYGGALLGLAGFSRISEDKLLDHPLRRQVFETIQSEPGIHASELARRVGSGWGTIVHHLQKLERAKLVTTRKVNNQKCFFENGGKVSRVDMEVASALKGDTASDIASFICHHPLTSQKDVAAQLGISPALASFHVKKLVAVGVIERVRDGKAWLLTTSDSFRRVADRGEFTVPTQAGGIRAVA